MWITWLTSISGSSVHVSMLIMVENAYLTLTVVRETLLSEVSTSASKGVLTCRG